MEHHAESKVVVQRALKTLMSMWLRKRHTFVKEYVVEVFKISRVVPHPQKHGTVWSVD